MKNTSTLSVDQNSSAVLLTKFINDCEQNINTLRLNPLKRSILFYTNTYNNLAKAKAWRSRKV